MDKQWRAFTINVYVNDRVEKTIRVEDWMTPDLAPVITAARNAAKSLGIRIAPPTIEQRIGRRGVEIVSLNKKRSGIICGEFFV